MDLLPFGGGGREEEGVGIVGEAKIIVLGRGREGRVVPPEYNRFVEFRILGKNKT
jgi:hypothetical protein